MCAACSKALNPTGHRKEAWSKAKTKIKERNNITTQTRPEQCEGSFRWDVKDLWLWAPRRKHELNRGGKINKRKLFFFRFDSTTPDHCLSPPTPTACSCLGRGHVLWVGQSYKYPGFPLEDKSDWQNEKKQGTRKGRSREVCSYGGSKHLLHAA